MSGAALRPGDVVRSRKGLHVEIDNTDAEGRLILADALAKAAEDEPELIIDFATLTGAARIALGPELPALFCSDDELQRGDRGRRQGRRATRCGGCRCGTPMTRCSRATSPTSPIRADSPMGGAIVAAMFMKRFVPAEIPWAHLDTFAWRDGAKPGRPKGGDALGLRAAFAALQRRYPRG